MIDSFLKYLQFEKRVSRHTLLAYQTDLLQLQQFIEKTFEESHTQNANHSMIRSWVIHLSEQANDPRTINRKIASLRAYFKFLLRQEVIAKDPMMKISALKTKKKLPSFVKEGEMAQLLDDNAALNESFEGIRTRLILELFYGTGMRLAELLTLQEKDINFHERTVRVLGKRNKERVIPIGKNLVSVIKQYQELRNLEIERKTHGLLLVTRDGEPCYPMMVYRIVKENLKKYTTAEKRSPHVLRHTYATHLLDKGAEINAVKDLLGHSSLAATQIYTHNSMEKLKKVFDQAHPKA